MKESAETVTLLDKRINQIKNKFWSKVNKEGPIPAHVPQIGGCWVWTGSPGRSKRYGRFNILGGHIPSHRFSWEISNGAIPKNMWVLHKCDNGWCVRPEHLFLGDNSSNQKDACAKGRNKNIIKLRAWAKQHPEIHRGEKCNFSKITEAQAREIKALKDSGRTQSSVGKQYGIGQVNVGRIWSGKRWHWI